MIIMKKSFFLSLIAINLFGSLTFCQNSKEYHLAVEEAFKLYENKEYLKSGQKFAEAFKADGNKGYINDRYNAACSWALANYPDSAFEQLDIIVIKGKFADYEHLTTDQDLENLYNDERWKKIKEIVKTNQEKAEALMDKKLKAELEKVFEDDQKYRDQIVEITKKYGWTSNEVDSITREIEPIIIYTDSLNLLKVTEIIAQHGWLGPDVVGEIGNSALWVVIQHAELKTQEKYLPVMREAVKSGNARADQLALLEDRVALREGRKQIYGSQFGTDPETKIPYPYPLEDPDNVDVRRIGVGLPTMQEYLDMYNLKWDPEQYKKDLPRYEAIEKSRKK